MLLLRRSKSGAAMVKFIFVKFVFVSLSEQWLSYKSGFCLTRGVKNKRSEEEEKYFKNKVSHVVNQMMI